MDEEIEQSKEPTLTRSEEIHYLLQSLGEYKKDSILAIVFGTLEIFGESLVPFIAAMLIDNINKGSDPKAITHYGIMLAGVAILTLIVGSLAGYLGAGSATGLGHNLRRDMFQNVQSFSHKNIEHFSTSSLVTRMTTDVTNIQDSYIMFLVVATRGPLMFLFAFTMAWRMAGKMALIYLAVAPILGVILGIIMKHAIPAFQRLFKRYDRLNLSINENITGMRTVKSYVRENSEIEKFEKATDNVYKEHRFAGKIISLSDPAMGLMSTLIFVFVIYIGSKTIITTKATAFNVGEFSALITYGFMILFSMMMFTMVFAQLAFTREELTRVCAVLKEKTTIANPENPIYEVKDGSVEFRDVFFKYESQAESDVLSDINLTIPSGSRVGIIGPTGSAKTSLVQLISRIYDTTSGSVLVSGHDVRDYDLENLRRNVVLVEQKSVLFSGTIADNLRWGNIDASDEEVQEAAHIACADSFIETFKDKYDTEITQGGSNVSGGQKQRLAIARALLRRPRIIIFDDSTSAVDTKTDAIIRKGLSSYAPETTQISIAQRISSVQDCDLIVVLDRGHIQATGTHEELLEKSPIYKDIYLSQVKLEAENSVVEGGDIDE